MEAMISILLIFRVIYSVSPLPPLFILYSGQVWPPNPRSVAGLADLGFLFMLPPTPRESSSGVRIGCTPLSVVTGPA